MIQKKVFIKRTLTLSSITTAQTVAISKTTTKQLTVFRLGLNPEGLKSIQEFQEKCILSVQDSQQLKQNKPLKWANKSFFLNYNDLFVPRSVILSIFHF